MESRMSCRRLSGDVADEVLDTPAELRTFDSPPLQKRNSSSSCELDKMLRINSTPKDLDVVGLTPPQEEALQEATAKAAPSPSEPLSLPFISITLTLAVAIAAALAYQLESLNVSLVIPDLFAAIEASACVAVGFATAPIPFAGLLWLSHGRNRTTAATPLVDVLCFLYGGCALAIPFLMPIDNFSRGMGLMGQALVTWIAFWKMCDIIAGTAPPAVLATPLSLLAHFLFLVEYQIDRDHESSGLRTNDGASTLPAAPWWRNKGLLGAETPPPGAVRQAVVDAAATGVQIALLGTARLHDPPAWLVASSGGLALQQALVSYSSVWCVYLNLKIATDANALGLTILGFRPKVAFRSPLTASTSPVDFWSRRWNMIVRGLFHRTIFTPMRARGVAAPVAALASFVVSGAFHEYAFYPANGWSTFGCEMIFFLIQAAFCTVELALKATGAHKGPLALKYDPPNWIKALGTTALLVPFSPYFMAPLTEGGTLDAMLGCALRLRFAWV